jgi:aspartyl-tRNA(Asn)/glutamyl-tRNA(Gln) amidotransferase subunit A
MMRGFPTRRGSRLIDPVPDTEDGPAVSRLKEAGAVILGKTTTPEFGWKGLGDSPLTGITRNPWNLGHTPGGSSAGAAAGLAAGMGPLALGTDGGGSIRIPSSFTGLPGLKPTYGRVPAYPPSAMGLLAHVGPMARTVADTALLLDVIAADDLRDPYALPPAGRAFRSGLDDGVRGLRVAFSPTLGYAKVDPEVAAAVAAAARAFAELGAEVEEADPGFTSPAEPFTVLWHGGASKLLGGLDEKQLQLLDPGLARVREAAMTLSAADYVAADTKRFEIGHRMRLFHQRYDLLLTPATAVPALPVPGPAGPPESDFHWIDWTPFSYPFNMTRQPAMSVPCGLTKAGLPIGLQIVGRLYDDHLVLRAARAWETRYPFPRPPALPATAR